MNRTSIAIAIIILAIVGIGLALVRRFGIETLSFCTVAAAVITFFYFASGQKESPSVSPGRLRGAIASAIVVEYLVLVGVTSFFWEGPEHLPPVTQHMITSFTSIVGVVIAFYFGSSAYVEAKNIQAAKSDSNKATNSENK